MARRREREDSRNCIGEGGRGEDFGVTGEVTGGIIGMG